MNGITNNCIVGISLDRSLEMMIGILAILKSGATYLPIDPHYPNNRISYMLDDSGAKLLISSSEIYKTLSTKIKTVCLDTLNILDTDLSIFSDDNINTSIKPTDLAYIIYTSGSTGKPKGVKLKHSSLVNLTYYCNEYVEYLKNNLYRAVVSVTTISFDIFIFETLISLQKGLKLVIANEKQQNIASCLDELIEKENIEIIQTTPSRMQLFYSNRNAMPHFDKLKFIVLAGEQLPLSLVKNLRSITNGLIYNGYGPSETTVFATLTDVTNKEKISIGKPLPNTQIYILDTNNQLCPIGVIGEICISGAGVGYGYINRDDITSKSFVVDPFNSSNIMYKSGDLGYYDDNGNIYCLGRLDHQVKIRGLRIELSEIEKVLLKFPNIISCTVIKNVDDYSHEFLCAYFVSNSEISISDLKNSLYKELPNYMVPQYFMKLDELPYTPNGKIDRKKLPIPKVETTKKSSIVRNNIDKILIDIFKNLLHLEDISIEDSLYDLGGDSLTAINLSIAILDNLNVAITVSDIFKHPTISKLSDYISSLSVLHRNIITPAKQMDFYPLSSAQKRIYFASSVDTDSVLYNIAGGIIINKILDTDLLQKCFEILINRHEILRTHFDIIENNIVQVIDNKVKFKLSVNNKKSSYDINKIYTDFVRPFDLSKAPLLRAKVIELDNNQMLLLIDMHHIICDGTSLNIFLQELCDLYNGNSLSDTTLDYKDFSLWEFEQATKDDFNKMKDFWVNQFADEIPLLNMPTSFPRLSTQNFDGANYYVKLSNDVFKKVDETSKNLKVTPYMLMLSAFYILLSKYSSQNDIVIGTPVVGRDLPELSNMLGMFVNTLALRNKVDDSLNFCNFVNHIKKYCLTAFENQTYPFNQLVKDLNVNRDISRNSLFDVMFIYQNNGYPSINFKNADVKYFVPDNKISKFDLSLEVIPIDNEFSLRFEYRTKLFDEKFVKELSSHYINILNIILENPDILLRDINMLSSDEEHQIIYDFNNTTVEYPKDKTIVDLFEEQVRKTPNKIALIFENKKLTYRQLSDYSNCLANYLIDNGIKENDIIGIAIHRSIEMILGILAILKVGATYLPIDPGYPIERINYMLKDSKASTVLIHSSTLNLNVDDAIKTINIDFNQNIYTSYFCNPVNFSKPNGLIYLIYTSGSTGKPKGVMVKHQNITNFILGEKKCINFSPNKVMVSVTTVCFDIFALELWGPLTSGMPLVLANDIDELSPIKLKELCKNNNVTMIQTTPSRYSTLLADTDNSDEFWNNFTDIMVGGEPFSKQLLEKLRSVTNAKIFNMYGPTETTVWSTIKNLSHAKEITIGKPIANTSCYILDKNKMLLPIGIPGNLYIGGDGVSVGYWDRKDLTKTKFEKSPFRKNEIIYDTGDLAYINSSFELVHLGRTDFQVKIRGYRIELAEIESKLLNNNDISECIVIPVDSNSKLCAYYVSNKEFETSELRSLLSSNLPNYMIPNYFIKIDEFPHTPNGKIDKKSLPIPNLAILNSDKEYIAPRSDLEIKISNAFQKVLGISPISIKDDFFELGGDSLLAMSLLIELMKISNNFTYSDIFMYTTVEELADKTHKNLLSTFSQFSKENFKKFESILETTLNEDSALEKIDVGNIFLTGVTGFLGIHILDEYLKQYPNGKVYCLIRSSPNMTIKEKLLKKLHFYFGKKYDKLIGNRIIIINGNIAQDNFGLSDSDLKNIAENVTTIINSAAKVSHYGDYSAFKSVNVIGTQNVITFCQKFNKKLYHISTLSVSGNGFSAGSSYIEQHFTEDIIFKENNFFINQTLDNVYVRSKFEAEKLILEAISNGLDAYIFRIGNLMARFSDTKFQDNVKENAYTNRLLTFLNIKIIPDLLFKDYTEFTPVDSCAQAIIKIIEHPSSYNRIFHLFDHNYVYVSKLLEVCKVFATINVLSNEDFKIQINNLLNLPNSDKLLSGILSDFDADGNLAYGSKIKLNSNFTVNYLKKIGFEWPIITDKYLINFIKDLTKEEEK